MFLEIRVYISDQSNRMSAILKVHRVSRRSLKWCLRSRTELSLPTSSFPNQIQRYLLQSAI
ncbi:polyketide synthase [Histoplasma ohiense]